MHYCEEVDRWADRRDDQEECSCDYLEYWKCDNCSEYSINNRCPCHDKSKDVIIHISCSKCMQAFRDGTDILNVTFAP